MPDYIAQSYLYILTGRHMNALHYMKEKDFSPSNCKIINRPEDLRGIPRGATYIMLDHGMDARTYAEFREMITVRDFQLLKEV